ncbi:MAG: hypothetical protein JWN34_2342 [Bryobacterales bacterium]|nr:hypothetical protein [Bryobacterales bacterium]
MSAEPPIIKALPTAIGQLCACGTPVVRRENSREQPNRNGRGFYYVWWLECPKCKAPILLEKGKQSVDPKNSTR